MMGGRGEGWRQTAANDGDDDGDGGNYFFLNQTI
jgi:hypothetical protein